MSNTKAQKFFKSIFFNEVNTETVVVILVIITIMTTIVTVHIHTKIQNVHNM